MAIVATDDICFGLRGRVGDLVFRRVHGKTVMSRRPRKPHTVRQSAKQKGTRSLFREASTWAKRILDDPGQREHYARLAKEGQLPNAYIAAVKQYMQNPAERNERTTPVGHVANTPSSMGDNNIPNKIQGNSRKRNGPAQRERNQPYPGGRTEWPRLQTNSPAVVNIVNTS